MNQIKSFLYTIFAVFSVLVVAYKLGGRNAKKSVELGRLKENEARLKKTIDVKKEVSGEIDKLENGAAADELRSDWMRK